MITIDDNDMTMFGDNDRSRPSSSSSSLLSS